MLRAGLDTRVLLRAHTEDHRRPSIVCSNVTLAHNRPFKSSWSTGRQTSWRDSHSRCEAVDTDVGSSTTPETRPAQLSEEEEAPSTSVPAFDSWELDFSSRPILDARGKKRWELLICSPDGSWVYSKWFPNNKINSTQVWLDVASCAYSEVLHKFSSGQP